MKVPEKVIFRCKADCMEVHWDSEMLCTFLKLEEKKKKTQNYRVNKTPSARLFRLVSKIRRCDFFFACSCSLVRLFALFTCSLCSCSLVRFVQLFALFLFYTLSS